MEAGRAKVEHQQYDYAAHTEPMLSHVKVGTGEDLTIRELSEAIQQVVEFKGRLEFDTSKADGTARKLLDVSRLKDLGWEYQIGLREGLISTYSWFLKNKGSYRS